MGKFLGAAEGRAEVLLGLRPILPGAGGDAGERIGEAIIKASEEGAGLDYLQDERIELGRLALLSD